MANNTRKKKLMNVKKKVMTIPELRKAFERLDNETKKLLSKGPINDNLISEFQKIWKNIFYMSIDKSAVEAYLQIQKKTNKKTRKSRMKGGSGPVDYMLRPGLDGTHGSYLPYVSKGLDFYNSINNIAMDSDCGKVNTTPILTGGDLSQMLGSRYVTSTVPPSVTQDFQDKMLGRTLGVSSSVLDTPYRGY
jgi:hypothetical protein